MLNINHDYKTHYYDPHVSSFKEEKVRDLTETYIHNIFSKVSLSIIIHQLNFR